MSSISTSDFDYPLPQELIAQAPAQRREQSRLMALTRADGRVGHHGFADLPQFLRRGDVLVVNDTRVLPARFFCRRRSGGAIEGLFLRQDRADGWEVLLKGAGRCKVGESLALERAENVQLTLERNCGQGRWLVRISAAASPAEILARAGLTPLPPYIRRDGGDARDATDRIRYQTVYARRDGAVAAPTAGLHFTSELLERLCGMGVEQVSVTLHVGAGTFAPVQVERPADHRMHSEWYELTAAAAEALNAARVAGRRIVAVGTTSLRVLETVAQKKGTGVIFCHEETPVTDCPRAGDPRRVCRAQENDSRPLFRPQSGWTDIFIYPPARFRAVDALVTNFHLPKSTLLMLVAAFCSPGTREGVQMILGAYAQAVQVKYRFFSYGDAMLIL